MNSKNVSKTAMITGASGAIGAAISEKIASEGFEIILAVRNEQKGQRIADDLQQSTGNKKISVLKVDTALQAEIENAAKQFGDRPLHILVNNAATVPKNREENAEGIEMQWAVNVLGYFRMIQTFQSHLKAAAKQEDEPSRIINVASYWAGGLNMDDPEFTSRAYDNDSAYRQAKQADRMLSAAFAEKLKDENIVVHSCHPGDVNSNLSNGLGFGGHQSPGQGAQTPAWLALAPEAIKTTGKYWERQKISDCGFCDPDAVEKLFQLCSQYRN